MVMPFHLCTVPVCAVELRGGSRNIKVATKKARVQGTGILWNETVTL